MSSPAHLLLIERLLAILTVLLHAIDLAAGSTPPSLRRAAARLLLSRLRDRLAALRNATPEHDPEHEPVSPPLTHVPPLPVRRRHLLRHPDPTGRASPSTHRGRPSPLRRLQPATTAARQTHARFVMIP